MFNVRHYGLNNKCVTITYNILKPFTKKNVNTSYVPIIDHIFDVVKSLT